MKQIQWYPGHMKKAQNELQEKLKLVDVVVELLDARIPTASRNKLLFKLSKDKTRLIVLTKKDLADPEMLKKWSLQFKNDGFSVIFADLNNENDVKEIVKGIEKLGEKKNQKYIDKGMKPQPVRAMIIGIPNVGKSTLINKVSKRHAASTENRPGKTRAQQWIKVSDKFELLDTPGILEPSYNNEQEAINLALVGSIKEEILPEERLALIGFAFMLDNYRDLLLKRFPYLDFDKSINENFKLIASKRGFLNKGIEDVSKAQKVFLNELKNGVLGQISFERI